jgi:hypothetical protein
VGPLAPGWHVWVWTPPPVREWAALCEQAKGLGLVGVIPQNGLDAPKGAASNLGKGYNLERIANAQGLQYTLGIGMDGHQGWKDSLGKVSTAILECIRLSGRCMLNWEKEWGNDNEDKARAIQVVDQVLAVDSAAPSKCIDAPWWAPLFVFRRMGGKVYRRATWPRAPTSEFGRLCKARFPQVYGATGDDGASARMLDHSRHPTQYAALGTPASCVFPSVQGYKRSVQGHVNMFLAEPNGCLWDWRELDRECLLALAIVQALRVRGFTGPAAVEHFQAAAGGLTVDGKVGPLTCRALGVPVPAGPILWRKR